MGAGVRRLRGCGLVPCGARLPATAGCPPRPGNARGCWDDRTGIVRTSTGRCFVGRSGFRGMSPDFGRTWYTRIRTAGVASPPPPNPPGEKDLDRSHRQKNHTSQTQIETVTGFIEPKRL